MAATEPHRILAATLLLPGLAAVSGARAEEPPEGAVSLKWGWYRDAQPGLRRVTVSSPQLHLVAPLAGQWSVEAARIVDSVSGATPRVHTFVTSATPYMADHRDATDLKLTRHFRRGALAVGAAYSDENDYLSRTLSAQLRLSSEDNNSTWTVGIARTHDRIDTSTTGGFALDERRRTTELLAGLTQVLTPSDALQVLVTRSLGAGYYSDPYKDFDNRPRRRNASILLARWNHHVEARDATLRTSWRFYRDSFGIRSHTLAAEWVQPRGAWTFAPGVRYYTQSAASFYFDPVPDAAGEPDFLLTRLRAATLPAVRSADHRLAAFGAVTLSMKVSHALDERTVIDLKLEHYRQAGHLRPGGGSPLLAPLRAHFVQLGWSRGF